MPFVDHSDRAQDIGISHDNRRAQKLQRQSAQRIARIEKKRAWRRRFSREILENIFELNRVFVLQNEKTIINNDMKIKALTERVKDAENQAAEASKRVSSLVAKYTRPPKT